MPRKMPQGLQELLARKNKQVESHGTLQVIVENAKPARNYYFATAELTIDNIDYRPLLKQTSQIRTSLTRAADQTVCEIHNADTLAGIDFLSIGTPLFNAAIKIGRWFKDLDAGAEYHLILQSGVIVGVQAAEDAVQLTAISEPYANIPCGAVRRVAPACQWIYKDPSTCGSTSAEPTCNFLLTHSGGCINRHSGTINRARYGGFAYLNSQNRLKVL